MKAISIARRASFAAAVLAGVLALAQPIPAQARGGGGGGHGGGFGGGGHGGGFSGGGLGGRGVGGWGFFWGMFAAPRDFGAPSGGVFRSRFLAAADVFRPGAGFSACRG